jgi:hypothetical protein
MPAESYRDILSALSLQDFTIAFFVAFIYILTVVF